MSGDELRVEALRQAMRLAENNSNSGGINMGMGISSGKPQITPEGVLKAAKQFANFLLDIEPSEPKVEMGAAAAAAVMQGYAAHVPTPGVPCRCAFCQQIGNERGL